MYSRFMLYDTYLPSTGYFRLSMGCVTYPPTLKALNFPEHGFTEHCVLQEQNTHVGGGVITLVWYIFTKDTNTCISSNSILHPIHQFLSIQKYIIYINLDPEKLLIDNIDSQQSTSKHHQKCIGACLVWDILTLRRWSDGYRSS